MKRLFTKTKNPRALKAKRPASIFLAFATVLLIMVLVIVIVVPQVTRTMIEIGNKIPQFLVEAQLYLEQLFASQPELLAMLAAFDPSTINWNSIVNTVGGFLKNGLGNMVTSTFSVASSIIGGVVNLFVSLIFSFYILAQKEKLGDQIKRVLHAYCSTKVYDRTLVVVDLIARNFSNYITGQCTEAVILGAMFMVAMAIFRFRMRYW